MVRCKQSWPEPGRLPDLGEAAGACVSQPESWRWPAEVTADRTVGTFPPGVCRWNDQAVVYTSSSLHLSTQRTFWTQTLVVFDICTDVPWDTHVFAGAYNGHFCFGGDFTKPATTIANIDRFYLNVVVCLPLDITLLFQNSVNIWHYLLELWQCIQGVTFFLDTV